MGKLEKEYNIPFVGLSAGLHEFDYILNDDFFGDLQNKFFWDSATEVKVTLEKSNRLFLLKFEIGGTLNTNCDRCGNEIAVNLWEEFNLVVKMIEGAEQANDTEEDPNIFYIKPNESHLQLKDWLKDFILLSIPQQIICENYESNNNTCNQEAIDKLNKISIDTPETNTNTIWKGLDKFKQNN